jgi:hypothetical protein
MLSADPLELAEGPLGVDIFDVGDVVEVPGHTVSLNSVEFLGDVLKANITLENQESEDMNVSSLLSFYARKGDGTSLEQEIFDCGTSLDGTIIPGDILKGDICWSGANADEGIKIYYEPELFGEGAVVWKAEIVN